MQVIDLDGILPQETFQWCLEKTAELIAMGIITREQVHDRSEVKQHPVAYLALRDEIVVHRHSGEGPLLTLLPKPRGGYEWQRNRKGMGQKATTKALRELDFMQFGDEGDNPDPEEQDEPDHLLVRKSPSPTPSAAED
jgi:hypothetical protein